MAAELDNSSSSFMRKDGPYSCIVLITIAVNVIFVPGFAMSSVGVFADIYPTLLNSDSTQTNIIGSMLLAVILFTGKIIRCYNCVEARQLLLAAMCRRLV